MDPCYVFHTGNARDLPDGGVELDVVAYPKMFDDRFPTGPETGASRLERWTLDPATASVKRRPWCEQAVEFPRYDERRTGNTCRYLYSVGIAARPTQSLPLYRHDLQTGAVVAHRYGPHHISGEAVFVPRAADAAEDDGWLLSFVHDLAEGWSSLVILNVADIAGEAQAIVELPQRVPLGFHGNWIADVR